MLCQKCHKNLATVRYAEVVEGKVADLHLCSECLAKHQNSPATGFELSGAAPSPLKRVPGAAEGAEVLSAQRTCRACGADLREVMKTGKVGCTVCYESFADVLEPLLRGIHTALRHRGKTPRVDDIREQARSELQAKRALLRSALRAEHYEEAAHLRDAIRELENRLGAALAKQE
ncbi:MAG: hypothetical protein HY706_06450 [Candidatus Hydrogenedentes bacterium]|nr:hypothetical protein [Candidatus Hydrogenedentota bacterium]